MSVSGETANVNESCVVVLNVVLSHTGGIVEVQRGENLGLYLGTNGTKSESTEYHKYSILLVEEDFSYKYTMDEYRS